MRILLLNVVAFVLITSQLRAQQRSVPRFENYPVKEHFKGQLASVKLTTRNARLFRTRLRENARNGVNFAGHYVAATWGCGSACWSFAIIDARTGQVHFIPS